MNLPTCQVAEIRLQGNPKQSLCVVSHTPPILLLLQALLESLVVTMIVVMNFDLLDYSLRHHLALHLNYHRVTVTVMAMTGFKSMAAILQ
jgi:hypothetical protein